MTTSAAPVKRRDLKDLLVLRSPLVTPDLERSRWLNDLRDDAMTALSEQLLPTTRDEEWRFTDIKSLADLPLQAPEATTVAADELERYRIPNALQLVFVDGHYAPELSLGDGMEGLTVG
ncbi:MAG: Fe-S cluster assembly protein SufD, partial [Elainellaceae cyanobacterium]